MFFLGVLLSTWVRSLVSGIRGKVGGSTMTAGG
jgi:hypothetical protein